MRISPLIGAIVMIATQSGQAGVYLGELTWQQAANQLPEKLVIIPFAAGAKEHGPHLPMNTDQVTMEHLLDASVAQRDVIVAPPILHGWFPAFRGYPGTEIATPEVFQRYVRAVAESLIRHGAKRLVLLNMGVSSATGLPLRIVARDLVADHGVAALVVSWDDLEDEAAQAVYEQNRGGHADEGETSIMLYLRKELVHMDAASQEYRSEPVDQIGYVSGTFDRDQEPGHYGDPTLATREKGERLLAIMRSNWLKALDQFQASTVR